MADYSSTIYRRNRLVVLEAAAGRCFVPSCTRLATTADHIVPLAAGGNHALENLRACCPYHNSSGGAVIAVAIRRAKTIGHRSRRW